MPENIKPGKQEVDAATEALEGAPTEAEKVKTTANAITTGSMQTNAANQGPADIFFKQVVNSLTAAAQQVKDQSEVVLGQILLSRNSDAIKSAPEAEMGRLRDAAKELASTLHGGYEANALTKAQIAQKTQAVLNKHGVTSVEVVPENTSPKLK